MKVFGLDIYIVGWEVVLGFYLVLGYWVYGGYRYLVRLVEFYELDYVVRVVDEFYLLVF